MCFKILNFTEDDIKQAKDLVDQLDLFVSMTGHHNSGEVRFLQFRIFICNVCPSCLCMM